ncbi:uncharacterized protein LOC110807327 [Carica papaya]|uniref:uncharacterized protein LOC110807327 n=1 Tax=Carica papaya TaxID=3649 RepID=UPI000B8CBF6D|nr:uncharacterized protein LOC110807327 [Carica papaya]
MDFFKVKRFRKAHKRDPEKALEDKSVPQQEQPKSENGGGDLGKQSPKTDLAAEFEDDDDDFITNEVKRRLKELRKNSFMALIPEEEELFAEEDEEGEEGGDTSSSEWRDVEAEVQQWWVGFDAAYDKYCDRMLFFDRMISQQLKEDGTQVPPTPSPRSASKKLTSPFRCLSLKSIDDEEETEHLQQPQCDPCQDLEVAYVAHICLTWEALHCQYAQLNQVILCQPEKPTSYSHTAQQFQQFQVLLQRFIENEPFEQGVRPEIYARARNLLPKLLQVPKVQGTVEKEMVDVESDLTVHVPELLRIIENSIITFYIFLKMDKRKANGVLNLFVSWEEYLRIQFLGQDKMSESTCF